MSAVSPLRAAIFDFGGVLTEPFFRGGAPLEPVLAGLARFFLADTMSVYAEPTGDHDLHLLETGRLSEADFFARLCARYEASGNPHVDPLAARAAVFRNRIVPCGAMIDAVRAIHDSGMKTALLTNNAREWEAEWRPVAPVDEIFDVIVDSSAVGLRKPDPAIYRLTCERLGVDPGECLFIDDLACNTDAAEALGMRAIHCQDPVAAAAEALSILLPAGAA